MNLPGAISSQSLKKKKTTTKKKHPQKNLLYFFKKSQPKQTSYTFLKNSMDQPRAIK